MGTIKDKNGMDLTEAQDIEQNSMQLTEAEHIKRWQEYTEELYKK